MVTVPVPKWRKRPACGYSDFIEKHNCRIGLLKNLKQIIQHSGSRTRQPTNQPTRKETRPEDTRSPPIKRMLGSCLSSMTPHEVYPCCQASWSDKLLSLYCPRNCTAPWISGNNNPVIANKYELCHDGGHVVNSKSWCEIPISGSLRNRPYLCAYYMHTYICR